MNYGSHSKRKGQIGYMGTIPEKQTLKMLLRIRGVEVTSSQTLLYLWEMYQIVSFYE